MPGLRCGENARCVRKKGRSFCQCNAPLQGDGFSCSGKSFQTLSRIFEDVKMEHFQLKLLIFFLCLFRT